MKSGGLGVGSASIVLVFAVLSLTIFSLITFYVAGNDKSLTDAKANAAVSYYDADARAEKILSEIIASPITPGSVNDTIIYIEPSDDGVTETMSFMTSISEISALYVKVSRNDNTFSILSWKMIMIDDWNHDDSLNLWPGVSN